MAETEWGAVDINVFVPGSEVSGCPIGPRLVELRSGCVCEA
jgi:hypothetical protein